MIFQFLIAPSSAGTGSVRLTGSCNHSIPYGTEVTVRVIHFSTVQNTVPNCKENWRIDFTGLALTDLAVTVPTPGWPYVNMSTGAGNAAAGILQSVAQPYGILLPSAKSVSSIYGTELEFGGRIGETIGLRSINSAGTYGVLTVDLYPASWTGVGAPGIGATVPTTYPPSGVGGANWTGFAGIADSFMTGLLTLDISPKHK